MKYPVRKRKTIDIVKIGQQPYTVREAHKELESRLPELQESRQEVEQAIIEHKEATPNFIDSLPEKAAEMGVYEEFQKAENYLGGNKTEGEQLREMLQPYVKEGDARLLVDSIDEKRGSRIVAKGLHQQDIIDKADTMINREIHQNKSNAETLNKDSPVLYGKALERDEKGEVSRHQEQHIRETINLANQSAKKDAEEAHKIKMKNPKIYEELSSFGIKKFPRFRREK